MWIRDRNEGLFDADILAILEKYDMKVTEVEYIVQWAEDHRSYEQTVSYTHLAATRCFSHHA